MRFDYCVANLARRVTECSQDFPTQRSPTPRNYKWKTLIRSEVLRETHQKYDQQFVVKSSRRNGAQCE